MTESKSETAVFGGGCFWCTEAVFAELQGVKSVMPGYAGGHKENPTYYEVCGETTGHAEVARIRFDPDQITYRDLLEVFFATHDPTTLNQQGADRGARYRSLILYADQQQQDQAEAFVRELDASGELGRPVVTQFAPLEKFYEAEAEHQQFYQENPDSMYCQVVISPKMAKLRSKFARQLRPG